MRDRLNNDTSESVGNAANGLLAAARAALAMLETMTTAEFAIGADLPVRQQLEAAIAEAAGEISFRGIFAADAGPNQLQDQLRRREDGIRRSMTREAYMQRCVDICEADCRD